MNCISSYHTRSRCPSRFIFCRLLFPFVFLFPIILHIPSSVEATNYEAVAGTSEENEVPRTDEDCGENINGCSKEIDLDDERRPTKRIVGGKDAPKNRHPYFVSLRATYNGAHKCGGSLVSESFHFASRCIFV